MTRPSPVTDDGLVELEQAAAALDHVASALQEVHSLSGMGDPAFDASMFGQISAVNRGASLLRRAASDRDVLGRIAAAKAALDDVVSCGCCDEELMVVRAALVPLAGEL